MPDSTITLRTRADLAALLETNKSFNVLTKAEQDAERAALSMAQSMARLDASLKQPAEGAARLRAALQNATFVDPKQGVAALNQIISLEQKAEAEAQKLAKANAAASLGPALPRTVERIGGEALDQLKSGLLGVVGPAALVTAGFTAATAAVQSFADAFKFNAQLEQNKASITAQLTGVRDSAQAFSEAAIFAQKYKLTQEETTTAIQASVPLLRQSKSSLTDVLTVLAKLQVLKPEQGIQGAAFALAELQGGQSRSLATRFNIPIASANELKKEIQGGADAVVVLGKYLDNAGIGAAALEARTKGAAGALNDLAQAEERRKIAQGGAAGGLGLTIVQAQTNVNNALANSLSGNANALYAAAKAADSAYNDAIARGATETDAARAKEEARIATLRRFTDAASQAAVAEADKARAASAPAIAQAADADDRRLASIEPLVGVALRAADADDRRAASAATVTNAIGAQIAAIDASVQKSQADAAAKDVQQAKAALLSEQSRLVVDAFLSLNPTIDASAAASLAAAQGYSPQIQQLIALGVEARNAKAALAGLNGGGVTEGRLERDTPADRAQARAAGAAAGRDRAAAAEQARRDQIRQTGTLQQKIALDQLELQEAIAKSGKGSAEAIAAQTRAIADRQSGIKKARGAGGSSTSADLSLAQAGLEGADRLQARLDAVNAKLATAKLSENERKRLTAEKLDLETKIGNELDKQNRSAIDAQLARVQDAQKRLDEAQELAAAQRVLNDAGTSEDQKARARLKLQEIPLEQAKRAAEINKLQGDSGGVLPNLNTPIPSDITPLASPTVAGAAATQGSGGQQAGIYLDGKQVGVVLIPYLMDALRAGRAQVAAAGG